MSNKCLSLQLLANEYSEASEERLCQLTNSIYEFAFDAFQNGDTDETDSICMEKLYPDLSDADEMFNGEQG
ncbi:MAG: hypothetical protein KAS73_07310 [Candidatus Sabulitectum sp.]|nr:hypothetical protein [Candidatus Sabulitectum sp.]